MSGSIELSLSQVAKLGFEELSQARSNLESLRAIDGLKFDDLLTVLPRTASPDKVLIHLLNLVERHPKETKRILKDSSKLGRLCMVYGASDGLAEFVLRDVGSLSVFDNESSFPVQMAVSDKNRVDLRLSYRRHLLQLADMDLSADSASSIVELVMASLSSLADAALEAGLSVAKKELVSEGRVSDQDTESTKLCVVSMGKTGAKELNYVSDVDVIYVAAGQTENFLDVATKLAQRLALVINESDSEPGLWEVDPNLRPEGKSGALVRTVQAHRTHFEKWAEPWEFQALLKARVSAGDRSLGEEYLNQVQDLIWQPRNRSTMVQDARAMRKRVISNLAQSEREHNVKLARGGLRDVEFTVQLLQLVHGVADESLRVAGTFQAIERLMVAGLLGREDASNLAKHYRTLRTIEHRIQLTKLRRSHVLLDGQISLRRVSRGLGIADAETLNSKWQQTRLEVSMLHDAIFYRPLLVVAAELTPGEVKLSEAELLNRLGSLGFRDPAGAKRHLDALTGGVSRRSVIQKTLLPVLIRWMADGTNPDAALLTFRRLSELLGESHWFLKMLRDSSGAAERLMKALSSSKYIARLLEYTPESTSWFADEASLMPPSPEQLGLEIAALLKRTDNPEQLGELLRDVRRRETLRVAIGAVLGTLTLAQISDALTEITDAYLVAMVEVAKRTSKIQLDFGIVAMGRYGGKEIGFGSDADVMFTYRSENEDSQQAAEKLAASLLALVKDPILNFELDLDLRPEGKSGPRVKSLEAYRGYYQKWADTWEFQALLRARVISGSDRLQQEFSELIGPYRYPAKVSPKQLTDIRLVKARVENERIPTGIAPSRHLKLGPGGLSDIEWLVQIWQLRHAFENEKLKSVGTTEPLSQLIALGLVDKTDGDILRQAWLIASRVRSALVLANDKSSDVLPIDRSELEAVARILEYGPGSATTLEQDYLLSTRRARVVFERLFTA
ncbi:MAG: bifunctional [glutamine synthetase] adenylyltransferase/[glutamine synthetase]-adenylyl-L-tyrosine phosphorylase [Aquiluna sp.]|nr:bifunctional [glutamine synthetase] adenylyltransferase/[glutamine synthetase]-adenylyl-L-tyrosine phosphorylase [Aquiluna sp.]